MCMHRILRQMHRFDLVSGKSTWVRSISTFAKIIQKKKKKRLYFALLHNMRFFMVANVVSTLLCCNNPQKTFSNSKEIHQQVQTAIKAHSYAYIQSQLKNRQCLVHSLGECVLHNKNNIEGVSTAHSIVFAEVTKRNLKNSMYKIKFTNPNKENEENGCEK